jgi:hypothetical protein
MRVGVRQHEDAWETPRAYATGAWLDITTVTLMVDAGQLGAALAPAGALLPVPEAPAGKHPVCIELCHIRDGRPEPGGLDLHAWSEMAGFWWGATAGWIAGAAMAGPPGAATGAAYSAAVGRRVARVASEATSRALGTYHEAMAFAPSVAPRTGARGPHLFSLGMHTDSPVSKRLSEVFGSGFGKRMASIAARAFDAYEVRAADEGVLLSARLARAAPGRWRPAREQPGIAAVIGWLSQPVLGHLGGGRLAVSRLDRFYDDTEVRVAPVSGRLAVGAAFAPGVPAGEHAIAPASAERAAGAFQAAGVPVKLGYPRTPRGGD